jgi:hypothetical protein
MGSGLAAKMETSELTAIIMCCVRSTPHMGAKLLNSAKFGMRQSAQPLTSAEKCRESLGEDVRNYQKFFECLCEQKLQSLCANIKFQSLCANIR